MQLQVLLGDWDGRDDRLRTRVISLGNPEITIRRTQNQRRRVAATEMRREGGV